ncbi:hypothetical protein [Novosphingobium endophyticum]|uniref:hypothetical protein n=1 Tax=Novosphingobium endophyticum TaxID=1955250 RepID=UPI00166E4190|nr:hypothetical protein [Novosphingobium endophyticum]
MNIGDDYAIRWIRKFERHASPIFNGRAYEVLNPHPQRLALFVSSVLWKCAASQVTSKDLDLGPWEYQLRNGVFDSSGFEPSFFVARKRWLVGGKQLGSVAILPYHAPAWGRRSYAFEIGDFLWGVKLDRRRSHAPGLFDGPLKATGNTNLIVLNLGEVEIGDDDSVLGIFAAAEAIRCAAGS